MKIIIDTNFILTCTKQKIDLFSQLNEIFPIAEIIIPRRVLAELEKLSEDRKIKVAEREAASVSLQILEKNKPRIIDLPGETDNSIVQYALENEQIIVATLDKEMRNKLENKAKMLTIKQKKLIARQ